MRYVRSPVLPAVVAAHPAVALAHTLTA